jgi:folate-binding Fe-S cluster repair protein YgfZ
MNQMTKTTSTQPMPTQTETTHTDNIVRIANALERIADNQELILSCDEERLEVLREFAHEFELFSRHGFGL